MEMNRNHYFCIGLVLLFLGIQLRFVDTYVLTPQMTNLLAEETNHPIAALNSGVQTLFMLDRPPEVMRKVIQPPPWLGWALLSMGSVLVLHALSMPKPATG